MSCSGSHDFLQNKHVIPTWHVDCDWREHKAEFVKNSNYLTSYLIASCVHPKFLSYLDGKDVSLWNSDMEPYYKYPEGELVFRNLACVGLQCITLAHALGFRNIHVYGMDCSFELDGIRHAGQNITETDKNIWVKVGNRVFLTSTPFVFYAKLFVEVSKSMPDTKISLAGDGLLQAYVKDLQCLPLIQS